MFAKTCMFSDCVTGGPTLKVLKVKQDQSRSFSPADEAIIKSLSFARSSVVLQRERLLVRFPVGHVPGLWVQTWSGPVQEAADR